MMDIDSIFAEVGDFGRQQQIYVGIINIVHLYLAVNVFQYAIVARNVDFYCITADQHATSTSAANSTVAAVGSELPMNQCPTSQSEACVSFFYSTRLSNQSRLRTDAGLAEESKGSGITHAKDSIHTSIISEWNLVCDRAWLKPLTMSVFMFSLLLGTAIFGSFSDRMGRKPILLFTTISLIVCDVCCSFVQSYELYVLFRGVCGYFLGGNVTVSYVLYYELLGTTKRNLAGFFMQASYSIGIAIVATLGYLISGWRHFTLATAFMGLPVAFVLFYLPESPRWLVSKGRYEQADAVLAKIVLGNGKAFKDSYRQTPPAQTLAEDEDEPEPLDLNYGGQMKKHAVFLDLFRNKVTAVMLTSSLCGWFICGLGYYVLTFASAFGVQKNDIYPSLALSGLVEIPGAALTMFLMGYSRRITVSLTFISWGVVGLISPISRVIPALKSTFLFYCKSSASAAFTLMFVCTSEILPTPARNTGVGLASTSARIGCVIAPFFYGLNFAGIPELSSAFLGLLALISGILWFRFIPETVHKSLPESVGDVIKLKLDTPSLADILCGDRSAGGGEEIQYSMLNQNETDVFGKENFDNVNFDYDDFNSSGSEEEIFASGGNAAETMNDDAAAATADQETQSNQYHPIKTRE